MQDIAKGDPEKENYFIKNAEFDVIILDDNLAPYYFSIQTFLDGFTVILDQQDYSNIEGGYGVFGSFFKQTHDLIIEPDYIRSYGYKTYN